ncbi:MAG: CRTAC1 family protein [Planctomycetota bacterium]
MKTLVWSTLALAATAASLPAQGLDLAAKKESHARMIAALAEIAQRAKAEHKYHGDAKAKANWAEMEKLGDAAPWKMRLDAALDHLRLGNTRVAIGILEKAHAAFADGSLRGADANDTHDGNNAIRFYLGMAWLRVAESDNCCAKPTPESCIMPLQGGALHGQTEGSTKAQPYFLEVIADSPEGDYWHLGAVWLLNLAHMTLGSWPDGVPEAQRLPLSTIQSKLPFPHFANVAERAGLDVYGMLGCVVADDFDGDADLDLLCSLWSADGQLRLYVNDGDGTFHDGTEQAGLIGITSGINLFQADYDNDGDLDVFLLRGAWLYDWGRHPNSLLQNQGDGTFLDVTFAAGMGEVHYPSSQADWGDFDNDGDLDLYVGNESSHKIDAPNQLWRNDGDGTFYDIAGRAGVENKGYTKGVKFGDYDDDGLIDIFVSNLANENRLYKNLGRERFVDVAPKLGMTLPVASFATWFWDYDNDGDLDIWNAAYSTGVGDIAAYVLGLPRPHPEVMRLWQNDGKGGFRDVAPEVGLDYPALPMGANFGDLDNDGFLDFYLGTGDPYYYSLMPNLMFKNVDGKQFVDVSMAGGFAHLQKGHGITFADLDNDHDLDVYAIQGGAYPGDAAYNALFENPGNGNHSLCVIAVGTDSNRSAIGARIHAVIRDTGANADFQDHIRVTERHVYRQVNSGGSFGANPLRQTIGTGKATTIARLEIRWPRSRKVQVLENVAVDQTIRVTEGKDGFEVVALPQTRLGGK